MQHRSWLGLRSLGTALAVLIAVLALTFPASALTTGAISGTITDASNKPLAGAVVTATAPSGRGSATTDTKGFFNIFNLPPDTYTVSITSRGYQDVVMNGVTVVQDQVVTLNQQMARTLQTIGRTAARSASNLVQPTQTADVYNVSSQQLTAAQGVGGHRTLYDVIQTAPGVTSTGVAGRPRIRGSDVGDVAWEYDGIPINDRLTGLFTTNLSVVGTQNLEVYTGGYNAQYGNAAAGIINSVVKRGTYPSFGSLTYTTQSPAAEVDWVAEYGGATRDGKWSWYASMDYSNSDPVFANGYQPYINAQALTARDTTPSTIFSRDFVGNFHFKPNNRDDFQFLVQSGNQKLPWNKGLSNAGVVALGLDQCNGVVVTPVTLAITNPGVSSTGIPCVVNGKNTGLQYTSVNQQNANVWYHWSNLGKIQWNHIFSEKLFAQFRLAENFNQYIFWQPFDLAFVPGACNAAGTACGVTSNKFTAANFPTPGTPAAGGIGFQDENSDRRSQMYFANLDFTYTPNARSTYYWGLGYERDNSAERYFDYCGCDDATSGSAFNLDGSYPNMFLAVDYPLILPDFYIGTKQIFGKLTLEPSLRYDEETYNIPRRPDVVNANGTITPSYAYGPYSTHAWSPRFGFTWAATPYDSIRGSWGLTTTFVPAAYVFNDSPNGISDQDGRPTSPYYPNSNQANQLNQNYDLSFSHALRNGVDSWRISPFYRHAMNKLELTKNYVVNPTTGLVTLSGPSYFRTGIQNKATGTEFGWNHVVRGNGLSWYFSGTYVNYWGSVTSGALAGGTPYGAITSTSLSGQNVALRQFLATGTLFRNPAQPPWSLSWTGDYRRNRLHVDPFVIYQVAAPYNVTGNTCTDQGYLPIGSASTGTAKNQNPCPANLNDAQVHFARANWWSALDIGYDIVKSSGRTLTLGFNVRNLFNNPVADVAASTNSAYPNGNNPDINTYGPGAVPNTLYYYAPDAQPRQFQLYLSTKF